MPSIDNGLVLEAIINGQPHYHKEDGTYTPNAYVAKVYPSVGAASNDLHRVSKSYKARTVELFDALSQQF